MSVGEAKGRRVAPRKEIKGCNNRERQVTFCDSLNIGIMWLPQKETLGTSVHHSLSIHSSRIGFT